LSVLKQNPERIFHLTFPNIQFPNFPREIFVAVIDGSQVIFLTTTFLKCWAMLADEEYFSREIITA
jgi:hypothetical protein